MDGLNHPSFIEIGYFAFNAIFNLVYTQSVKLNILLQKDLMFLLDK